MPIKKVISKPFFSFILKEKLELKLKNYINSRKNQEISGGLIGFIKGGKRNNIIFDIKQFLPFPNLAEDPQHFAMPRNLGLKFSKNGVCLIINNIDLLDFYIHTQKVYLN